MDLAEHAMEHVIAGRWVFPLRTRSKLPATKNGFHDATDDPGRVHSWWARRPTSNIGIATGASGLVVIDLDTANGDDHCAEAFTAFMALAHDTGDGDLPGTYEVGTPSGGEHHYYRVPEGAESPRNSASKIGPHIDVRADGGYVVGAGSRLAVEGDALRAHLQKGDPGVVDYTVGHDVPIAEAPGWLIDLCRAEPAVAVLGRTPTDRPTAPAGGDEPAWQRFVGVTSRVAAAPTGKRNALLYWAAKIGAELVIENGLSVHRVTGELMFVAARAGLTETETYATMKSAFKKVGVSGP